MSQPKELLNATVEIYNSTGGFAVFCEGNTGTTTDFDRIRLAVHYISLVQHLCATDSPDIRYGLSVLFAMYGEIGHELKHDAVRGASAKLEKLLSDSIADTTPRRWRKSEKYVATLVLGRYRYALANFSMFGFKPNLAKSAALLFCDSVRRLNNERVEILAECVLKLMDFWFIQKNAGTTDYSQKAFVATEGTFLFHPESVPSGIADLQVLQFLRLNPEQVKLAEAAVEAAIVKAISRPPSWVK